MSTNPLPSPVPGQTLWQDPLSPAHTVSWSCQSCSVASWSGLMLLVVSSAPSMLRGTRIRCWYGGWDFASESRSPVFPEEQGDFQHWLLLDKGK